ncbi:MAG TPA: hypothetical protein VIJ85_05305 [Rhizomicrobium sp.]
MIEKDRHAPFHHSGNVLAHVFDLDNEAIKRIAKSTNGVRVRCAASRARGRGRHWRLVALANEKTAKRHHALPMVAVMGLVGTAKHTPRVQ